MPVEGVGTLTRPSGTLSLGEMGCSRAGVGGGPRLGRTRLADWLLVAVGGAIGEVAESVGGEEEGAAAVVGFVPGGAAAVVAG